MIRNAGAQPSHYHAPIFRRKVTAPTGCTRHRGAALAGRCSPAAGRGIRSIFGSVPSMTNPLSAKGVGEGGTVASTPTVIHAILDALGHGADPRVALVKAHGGSERVTGRVTASARAPNDREPRSPATRAAKMSSIHLYRFAVLNSVQKRGDLFV